MVNRNLLVRICVGTMVLLAACAPATPSIPTVVSPTAAPAGGPAKQEAQPTALPAAAKPGNASPSAAKPPSQPGSAPATFDEQAVGDFFRGKTIRIVVGYAPGGVYDLYARLVAKHMSRFVPGSPSMIVENKPGAGSMVAANTVYAAEPKDGTVIATFNESLLLQQAIGEEGVEFDGGTFNWLGSTSSTFVACLARRDSGINSIQDVMNGKELVVGTLGKDPTHYTPAVLNTTLGTSFKLVPGYGGASKLRLALETNEIGGYCLFFDGLLSGARDLVAGENPVAKIIVVTGTEKPDHPLLKDVPVAEALAKTDEAKVLLRTVSAPQRISKPFALPPGVPQDRVAALRQAFDATMADPQFLAEAKQARQDPSPSRGEEVQRVVQEVLDTPPALLGKLKDILK